MIVRIRSSDKRDRAAIRFRTVRGRGARPPALRSSSAVPPCPCAARSCVGARRGAGRPKSAWIRISLVFVSRASQRRSTTRAASLKLCESASRTREPNECVSSNSCSQPSLVRRRARTASAAPRRRCDAAHKKKCTATPLSTTNQAAGDGSRERRPKTRRWTRTLTARKPPRSSRAARAWTSSTSRPRSTTCARSASSSARPRRVSAGVAAARPGSSAGSRRRRGRELDRPPGGRELDRPPGGRELDRPPASRPPGRCAAAATT